MLQAYSGKTGARDSFEPANAERVRRLRAEGVTVPILPGIGISHPDHASQAIAARADGFIIGLKVIAKALRGGPSLPSYLTQVRTALDG